MSEPIRDVKQAVAELGALPVPVGPQPQEPKPIAYARKITDADLLLAHRSEKQRAAEWPWDMWCRICHIRPTSHRTEAEALEAADQHVKLYHAPQDEVHRLMMAGGLAEFERLRTRIAELEAAPKTVFRAEHPDSGITLGLYGAEAAARDHCEDLERRSWLAGTSLAFDWIEDDGVAELVVTAGQNEESVTGYVVTTLDAPSEYDKEADE